VQIHDRDEITSVARSGVTDQNIDTAVLLDSAAHHCFNLRAVGNVCDDWQSASAKRFDFLNQAVQTTPAGWMTCVRIPNYVINDNVSALLSKAHGHGATKAALATRTRH
jgi:hypothetical protein